MKLLSLEKTMKLLSFGKLSWHQSILHVISQKVSQSLTELNFTEQTAQGNCENVMNRNKN